MRVYYDNKLQTWYQISSNFPLKFGANQKIAQFQAPKPDHISLNLRVKDDHIGPVIGIIAGRNSKGYLVGNRQLFIDLQKKLISQNGVSFIFTPEDVLDDSINGALFIPADNKWVTIKAPFPDLVYNRIPYRRLEKSSKYQNIIKMLKEKNIPFFNPCFINKFELYQTLHGHSSLSGHLPETILADQEDEVLKFLQKHQHIYLKPLLSSQGKGIIRLSLEDEGQLTLEGLSYRENYISFKQFWEDRNTIFQGMEYLAQEGINSAKYNGKRFDFRVLAHADEGDYIVSGIGIRQSQDQEITTHIPAGGKLIPYHLLSSKKHDQFFKMAARRIGMTLSNQFGFFGEFSIDAGINESGQYFIYEVNSKPMKFDEKEIEESKINQLCSLFLQLTNF